MAKDLKYSLNDLRRLCFIDYLNSGPLTRNLEDGSRSSYFRDYLFFDSLYEGKCGPIIEVKGRLTNALPADSLIKLEGTSNRRPETEEGRHGNVKGTCPDCHKKVERGTPKDIPKHQHRPKLREFVTKRHSGRRVKPHSGRRYR